MAQKAGAVETTAGFFRKRDGDAKPEDLRAIPAPAPDRPADPGDVLPPGMWRRVAGRWLQAGVTGRLHFVTHRARHAS